MPDSNSPKLPSSPDSAWDDLEREQTLFRAKHSDYKSRWAALQKLIDFVLEVQRVKSSKASSKD